MKRLLLIGLLAPLLVQAQLIRTVAGIGTQTYSGDNAAAIAAGIDAPIGIAADNSGNYYILDGSRCLVRKVNSLGIISTYAGHSACFKDTAGKASGDGEAANAGTLNSPSGIATDLAGNIYIADQGNNRVRKVNTSGIITTYAGTGATNGATGDGGPATAAELIPIDVATDAMGNVYVTDKLGSSIRRIDVATRIITTIAGIGTIGAAGDGGAATAARMTPNGLTVDSHGNIYVTDGTSAVRRIDGTTGIINTVAGSLITGSGSSGDGSPATAAKLDHPMDVAVDTSGNLYIADMNNNVIRKVNAAGIISCYAGSYASGFAGNAGNASAARLNGPVAIAIDATNGVLIADLFNFRVRKAGGIFLAVPEIATASAFTVYPNPASATITITAAGEKIAGIRIVNMMGQTVLEKDYYAASKVIEDVSGLPTGLYFIRINNGTTIKLAKQ